MPVRHTIAVVAAILLTACSNGRRMQSEVGEPPSVSPVAPPSTPSIDALEQLQDHNNLLARRSIYYRNNAYTVATEYLSLIGAHAEFLRGHPHFAMRVEGNSDDRGSGSYNLALAQRRADFVKRALVVLGADPSQITAVSQGSEKPKVRGRSEAARARNRRSDLLYVDVDTR